MKRTLLWVVVLTLLCTGMPGARAGADAPHAAGDRTTEVTDQITPALSFFDAVGLTSTGGVLYGDVGLPDSVVQRHRIRELTRMAGTALGLRADNIQFEQHREGENHITCYLGGTGDSGEKIAVITYARIPGGDGNDGGGSRLQSVISLHRDMDEGEVAAWFETWHARLTGKLPRIEGAGDLELRWALTGELDGRRDLDELMALKDRVGSLLDLQHAEGQFDPDGGAIRGYSRFFGPGYTFEIPGRSRTFNVFLRMHYDPERNASVFDIGTAMMGI